MSQPVISQLKLSQDDADAFARMSHDRSPLHVSQDAARRTAFGEPIVHGVLVALEVLSVLPERSAQSLSKITLTFHQPVFAGVTYAVEIVVGGSREIKARLRDGSTLVLQLSASFVDAALPEESAREGRPPRAEAVYRERVSVGDAISVEYALGAPSLSDEARMRRLAARGVGRAHVAALAGCSYVIGMELPGALALFSKLSLELAPGPVGPDGTLRIRAHVADVDERFGLAVLEVDLDGAGMRATGKLRAFVRAAPRDTSPTEIEALVAEDGAWTGRVAVVTGASRGLGAALALVLARRGCCVYGTFVSGTAEAERITSLADGRVRMVRVDARDARAMDALRAGIEGEHGGVDLLVCSASPALKPLALELDALDRIHSFLRDSVQMTSSTLAAFIETLSRRSARVVFVSSAALDAPPADWPHYVAAKAASEAMVCSLSSRHPGIAFTIARPPRLRTDMMASAGNDDDALSPERAAAAIVRALDAEPRGGVERIAASAWEL